MKKIITLILSAITILISTNIQAQEIGTLDWSLKFGFNIGGTMPMPLPEEVRKIEEYDPKFNPHTTSHSPFFVKSV